MANGFFIQQTHNDKKRCTGFCKVDSCPWKVVASSVRGGPIFKVRTFVSNYTCQRNIPTSRPLVLGFLTIRGTS